jgi:HAD superfamily hydrolase (TIGR01509 family)
MKIGFVFDLNGTIIKSSYLQEKAILEYLKYVGIEINYLISLFVKNLILLSTVEISKRLKDEFKIEDGLDQISNKINLIKNEILKKNKLDCKDVNISYMEGFYDFCIEAKNNNILLAIATNAPIKFIKTIDEILNLKDLFGDNIFSCEHVGNVKKPNPKLFVYAMNQLKLDYRNCCIFEDSESGIIAANAAGAGCIVRIESKKTFHKSEIANIRVKDFTELKLKKIIQLIS